MDFGAYSSLEDLETGETVQINPAEMKRTYMENMEQYLAATRMQLLEQHIFYRMIPMDQPLDKALRDFLNQRQKSMI